MIELSEVIRGLRQELEEAIAEGEGKDLRFEVGPVEVEVTVAVTREAKAGAKVKFWVVEANAEGKLGDVRTQRVMLTLEPRLASTGRRPEVAGRADERER
ncbi:trypco2 family protein [Sinosporangium siamense]|uniref:Trypsin-co-occurring domain-containing protein n=1 Tax=Sinosporangium siamense TaxID=1367973 RepID=A0A919RLU1_9ACTN|nr:trypco2 family protein [Sinosporangium siamense]GII96171.1 hypothetical protein Ssi02_64020 [Sinosporangium siamense]